MTKFLLLTAFSILLATPALAQTDVTSAGAAGNQTNSNTAASRAENTGIYAVPLNDAWDMPAPTGQTNPTITRNYRSMLDTEVSTLPLATGSVSPVPFGSEDNLGFPAPGLPTQQGSYWPTPPVGTGSVDADILDNGGY
jgi:hypothetical protein